jgi:hypothetical protein
MSSQEDNTKYLEVQTHHYNFQMKMTKKEDTYQMVNRDIYYFSVGDDKIPCLEGNILLDDTVDLTTIDALYDSSIEDINKEYLNAHTFGKEVLDEVIFLIKTQFPIIKTIILNDRSYIPYRTDTGNTLDLLTYSIGLYKKTWYEERLGAYILPKEKHEEYRKQVEEYASKDTKDNIPFFHIYHIMRMNNIFARDIIWASMQEYEKMYDESETLPEFFQRLSKNIKLEEKCKFFKGWLPQLIHSKITLTREWHFDIYPKVKEIK